MDRSGRRRLLAFGLAAALLPLARAARAAGESHAWVPPPVGLVWQTQGAVLWSDGRRYLYDYENEVEAVDGDLVTYVESTHNRVDDSAWQTRIQTYRFWETRWEQRLSSGERVDREAQGRYAPQRLAGFWPWRRGTLLKTMTAAGPGSYRLEAFEDLEGLEGGRRRAARFAYAAPGEVPSETTCWCDVEHGLFLKLRGSDGTLDEAGQPLTRKVELDLVAWRAPG